LTAVLPALVIGAFVLARKKGTPVHRATGWLWVSLMLVVDVSAFFLQRDGYSWIHLLALAIWSASARASYLSATGSTWPTRPAWWVPIWGRQPPAWVRWRRAVF